jgi:protein-tyrosine phosphatase
MAAIAADNGIQTVIATPHTDGVRVSTLRVCRAVDELNTVLHQKNIPLEVLPGYEIPYHLAAELASTHTLAGSSHVLVEFPHSHVPIGAFNLLYDLVGRGLVPVIAHPERNRGVIMDPGILADMVDSGAQVQVTAASITGELGPDAQQCAHYLLRNNVVHFIATDSHSPSFRKPVFSKALKVAARLIGREKTGRLVLENPAKILEEAHH